MTLSIAPSLPSPPPGWYDDPSGAPLLRYFDDGWTLHTSPRPSTSTPRGWYDDPSGAPCLRYYDLGWTDQVRPRPSADVSISLPPFLLRAPRRLPTWLPLPVLVPLPFAVVFIIACTYVRPTSPLLAMLALVVVGLPLLLLDRMSPRPFSTRLALLLFGATASVVSAIAVEAIVQLLTHSTLATLASAGPIEETSIAAGLWWLSRRYDVITTLDSVIAICWCALGFTVLEDMEYYAAAPQHQLLATLVARGIVTPFAHPLFSSMTAIGFALYRYRGKKVWLFAGLVTAAVLHSAWDVTALELLNSSKTASASSLALIAWLFIIAFFLIFVGWAILVLITRHRQYRAQCLRLPALTIYVGLPTSWLDILSSAPLLRHYRSSLPRQSKEGFDAVITTLNSMANRPSTDPLQPFLALRVKEQYRTWLSGDQPPAPRMLHLPPPPSSSRRELLST